MCKINQKGKLLFFKKEIGNIVIQILMFNNLQTLYVEYLKYIVSYIYNLEVINVIFDSIF